MSEAHSSSTSAIIRAAVPAGLGFAALVVPGLPVPAAAAIAAVGGLIGALSLAAAGRARLQGVELRFIPPELPAWQPPIASPAALPQPGLVADQAATSAMMPAPLPTSQQLPMGPVPARRPPSQGRAASAAQIPRPGVPLATAAQTQMVGAPSEVVSLGPSADPAFPSWRLHWQLPDGREGLVVLPSGDRTTLGRQGDCHIVVQLEEVSRVHLLLSVSRTSVQVTETGSSNGTWHRQGGAGHHAPWSRIAPKSTISLAPSDQLRIADPWAIVLTLESAGR